MRRTVPKLTRGAVAGLLLASTAVVVSALQILPAHAAGEPYRDPTLPVATRVADLLARMSLDEKIGQMTQAERGVGHQRRRSPSSGSARCSPAAARRPSPNNATGWANMYDGFQNAAPGHPAAASR